jgi:microtubule-associated protein-like 6
LKVAKEWVSDVKFSHDSQTVAVGSHDNTVYLYSFPDMKLKNKPLRKHASYITHIDFS